MKLPNGYGSVSKLAGKRRKPYAARITVEWTPEGKQVKKYLGYYRTRQEAMKALSDYAQNPFDLAAHDITFAELYDRWAKVKFKGEKIPFQYTSAYQNAKPLHDMTFADIRKRHIQGVIDTLEKGFVTARRIKTLCTQMSKYAIDQELITTNYAALVELPKHVQSDIHKPFTKEELGQLWEMKDDPIARIALILCYTGMRPTELLEVKKENVKLDERYLIGGVKTEAGKNRAIPISEKILSLMVLFLAEDRMTYDTLLYKWKRKNILSSHLPHDGRHTCATLMDDADIPLKIRQQILGHTSKDITNRVYTHKTIQQLVDAINRI